MSHDSPPTESLTDHTVSLGTADPAASLPERGPLRDRLADAAVVGLGEATHGTREFFELKGQFIRHMVAELDCRLVALEANFPETLAVNEYIVHGEGDPEAALDGIYFWTWNVEAVRDLIEWLRAFNAERPPDDRVRFHGVDVQYTTGAVDRLRDFLREADPALLDRVDPDLATVDGRGVPAHQDEDASDAAAAATELVPRLRDRIRENREAYVRATSERDAAFAERFVTVIDRATDYRVAVREWDAAGAPEDDLPSRALYIRDKAMAENAAWLLERTPTERIALWAHDSHLNRVGRRRRTEIAGPSAGTRLAERYGEEYLAVGFSFGGGEFQAIAPTEDADDERTLRRVSVPRSETGAFDDALGATGHAVAFLDVRGALADGERELADWLGHPCRTFETGVTYDPSTPEDALTEYRYAEAFDAVYYVDSTTRARPLSSDSNE
ncbi:erythromycin esterase family protein [Halorubrum sp. RMP-47]|uniref:Erythromycin esterase family protein n=1 Tax=Halorubrum miltondacostae TaxID=3076378 RepID=A0ABD5M350_9EURY